MSDLSLIRKFRRSIVLATVAIFALGLAASLILRSGTSLWSTASWTAICSPIVVGIAICLLQPVERMAVALGFIRAGHLSRLRPVGLLWALAGIGLPWIAAWLVADASSSAFASWWHAGEASANELLIWIARVGIGAVTYSLASALGVVLSYRFSLASELDQD